MITREEQQLQKIVEDYQHQVYNLCLYMIGNQKKAVKIAQSAFIRFYLETDIRGDVSRRLFHITADIVLT